MSSKEKKPKKRKDYKQKIKEAEIERQHIKRVEKAASVDVGYEDDTTGGDARPYKDQSALELRQEWEALTRYAKVHFPEGADNVSLTGSQKLVAIADILGWPAKKIAAASGYSDRSVYRLLSPKDSPEVAYFANQFRAKLKGNAKDILKDTQVAIAQWAQNIINDPAPFLPDKKFKFDVMKWSWEAINGKPGQTIEHKGDLLKNVLKAINETELTELDEASEKELFDPDSLH